MPPVSRSSSSKIDLQTDSRFFSSHVYHHFELLCLVAKKNVGKVKELQFYNLDFFIIWTENNIKHTLRVLIYFLVFSFITTRDGHYGLIHMLFCKLVISSIQLYMIRFMVLVSLLLMHTCVSRIHFCIRNFVFCGLNLSSFLVFIQFIDNNHRIESSLFLMFDDLNLLQLSSFSICGHWIIVLVPSYFLFWKF